MKMGVYQESKDQACITCFVEEVTWKRTDCCDGPTRWDDYIISDGKGNLETLCCTGDATGKEAFNFPRIDEYEFYLRDGDTAISLTCDELNELYSGHRIWYWEEDSMNDVGSGPSITIFKGDAIPKYFLDTELTGPMDSEIENYPAFRTDFEGKPL